MKKAIFACLTVLLLFCGVSSLAAQENQANGGNGESSKKFKNESSYYVFSFPIEKIYQHRDGYVVLYRKSANRLARTHIPAAWFGESEGKADIIVTGSGSSWPYMSVYEKEGAFSHLRLYVSRSKSHETWGVVPLNVNTDDYFEGVEEVQLEF